MSVIFCEKSYFSTRQKPNWKKLLPLHCVIIKTIDFNAKKYKIKIRLEEKHNPSLIDRLISIKNNSTPTDIPLLKLYGKNELGVDETINFIESVYTKTVPLALTDDTATNINYIKNKLEEFLNLHLGKIAKY